VKPTFDLSLKQARRIALTAQGFAESRRHAAPGRSHFGKVAGRLGVIQIDSVNVVTRTHYLPAFSRLGDYPQGRSWSRGLGQEADPVRILGPRGLAAAAGDAAAVPLAHGPGGGRAPCGRPGAVRAREGGTTSTISWPRSSGAVRSPAATSPPVRAGQPGWWSWSEGKRALEWLFWTGYDHHEDAAGFRAGL
jgi:hypothetical protein